jgi:rSAM/selenodomain-associated transferase 1
LVCYYPPDSLIEFKKWLGNNFEFIPQRGNNLGERLKNCFLQGFELGYNNLIVIGSDSPDLPEKIINESIEKLKDFNSVIGPSEDGGYYLIGFTKHGFSSKVFEGITWSTSSVFEETVEKLKSNLIEFYKLEKWHDVDTIEDLKELYKRNINTDYKTSKTMIFLKKNIEKG